MTAPQSIWISVPHPDDPAGPPIYEGPAEDAYRSLVPGIYQADPGEDSPEPISVLVEQNSSHIQETTGRGDREYVAGVFWGQFTPHLTAAGYPPEVVNAVIGDHVERSSTEQLRSDCDRGQHDNRLALNMLLLAELGTAAVAMLGREPQPGTNIAWNREGFQYAYGDHADSMIAELTNRISVALGGHSTLSQAADRTTGPQERLAIEYVASLPGLEIVAALTGTDNNPADIELIAGQIRQTHPEAINLAAANYWQHQYTQAMTGELQQAGYPAEVAATVVAASAESTVDWMDYARAVNSPEIRLTLLPALGRAALASGGAEPVPGTNARWQLAAEIMTGGTLPLSRAQAEAAADQHTQQRPHAAHLDTSPPQTTMTINTSPTGVRLTVAPNHPGYAELAEHLDANHFQPVIDELGTWTMPTPEANRTRTNFRLSAVKAIGPHLGFSLLETAGAAPAGPSYAATTAPSITESIHRAFPQR
ncbi:hypothetical protein ABIB25_000972 [Nakamurella sp. UYEF19]|uniref:hypothetical protein n=1 Tax=Nakamurella sp. UYEF19 TaxID=1756392 RepID=UPI00339970B0